jgi:hypothetical protein
VIDYTTAPPFHQGLDRQWLGFFQYTTGMIFVTHNPGTRDPFNEFGDAKVFDPRAEWLLLHQEARPYGTESVLAEEGGGGAAPAAGGAGGAAPAPAGGQPPPPGGQPPPPGGAAAGGNPADPKIVGPAVGGGVVLPQ